VTTTVAAPDLLTEGYRRAARITRDNGTTYYWGTMLLPPERRRHVYAVYALCRMADDIVDAPSATQGDNVPETTSSLTAFRDEVGTVLDGGPTDDPVLAAIGDSFARCAIPRENVDRFFRAMAQDLTTTAYETWDDLVAYMEGSAAVIGEMMLPVLRPRSPEAFEPARALGFAFQLTNFLRDVGEDLDRGRVYIPQEDLRRFGADPWSREVTPGWRELMRFEIARNRELYAQADAGIPMLPRSSARCVATARELYARILELIESRDYDVFTGRARVASWSKATTSARILAAGPPQKPGRKGTL
jgi:phytoene synthase